MTSASSVTVDESITAPGQGAADIHMMIFAGGSASGTFSEGSAQARTIVIGTTTYIQGNLAYWQAQGVTSQSSLAELSTHWVYATAPGQGAQTPLSIPGLASAIRSAEGSATRVGLATVHGILAVGISSASGGDLWVANRGPAYPVEITRLEGADVIFSAWNQGTPPSAPPGAIPEGPLLTPTA